MEVAATNLIASGWSWNHQAPMAGVGEVSERRWALAGPWRLARVGVGCQRVACTWGGGRSWHSMARGAGKTGLAKEEGSLRGNWLEQPWALVTAG